MNNRTATTGSTPDFNELYLFAQIVKTLNMTQTAENLGYSKAHVSQKLKQLESRLNLKLIERSTRHMQLTEMGRELYNDIAPSFELISQAVERIEANQQKPKGVLRISAPVEFGQYLSQNLLGEFLALYPDIVIDLDLTPDRRELLSDQLDLLVRVGEVQDSSYIYRKIFETQMGVFAAPQQAHRIQKIRDVKTFKWIASGQEAALLGSEHPILNELGKTVMVCKNLTARKQLIANGVGIGLLPCFIFQKELESGEIIQVLPEVHSQNIPFGFIYASKKYTPLKIKHFVQFVVEKIGQTLVRSKK